MGPPARWGAPGAGPGPPGAGPHRPTRGCGQGPRDPTQTCGLPSAPCRPKAWPLACGTHTERPVPARPGHGENGRQLCQHPESTPHPPRHAELTPPVCLERPPARARGAAGSSLAALPLSCVFTGRLAGEWAAPTPGDNAPPGGRGAHTSTFFLRFQSCLHVVPGMCLCGAKLPSDKQLPANPSDTRACPSSLTRPLCGSSSLRFDPKTQKSVTSDSL